jgi:O-antigen ligase
MGIRTVTTGNSRPSRTSRQLAIGVLGLVYVSYIIVFSLLPTSWNPRVKLPPFYSSTLSFGFVLFGLIAFLRNLLFSRFRFHRQWTVLAAWLLFVGIVGTLANELTYSFYGWLCLIWPMFILVAAPSLVHWVVERTGDRVEHFRFIVAVVTTMIALVYALATVVAPRLGFRGGIEVGFGEARLTGPIGNAAIIYVIILPTAAYWLSKARQGSKRAWLGVSINILGLILTFSRAAVLSLALWLVWIVLLSQGLSLSSKAVVVLLTILVVLALSLVWSSELASRLTLTEDPRLDTSMAGLRAFSDSPIWGHGYSHMWPWWQRNGELLAGLLANRREGLFAYTPYGWVLWNPHSLVALVGAETGILGAVLVLLLFGLPLIRARREHKRELFGALLVVIAVDSLLGGSFYASPELASVWWIYVASLGVEGRLRAGSHRHRAESATSARRIRFSPRSVM